MLRLLQLKSIELVKKLLLLSYLYFQLLVVRELKVKK